MSTDAMTSPYRGLTPYTEADAAYFFGRTAESATVAANLEVSRLTIFYGPSGVGKSSVLRAGVIHQLRERARQNVLTGGAAEIIPIYFNRWQSDPMAGLVQAVAEGIEEIRDQRPETGETGDRETGRPGDRRPGDRRPETGRRWTAIPDLQSPISDLSFTTYLRAQSQRTASDLLLVLDQFEEYFLYHADEAGPGSFAHELVAVLTTPALRVNVLLALREDALARLDRFQGQIPFLLDNRLSIGHLGRAAGEEAIRRPLAQYNRDQGAAITIEPALVEAVLDQVGSGRVTLSKQGAGARDSAQPQDGREQIEAPYLQLVLTRLWDEERANRSAALRMATLDSLGGAETIVRNYLDDTLAALDPADQALAASFFDRLVTPSGTKIALSLDEIAQYAGGDRVTVEDLLNRLQDRRLLRGVQSPGGVTQYEIFHDVLGQAMLDWQARYRQAQEETKRLAEEQAARAEAEQRANEAAARAQLEERARRAEQRSANRLRWLVGVIGLLLVAAIGLTILAFNARNDAQAAQKIAEQEKANAQRRTPATAFQRRRDGRACTALDCPRPPRRRPGPLAGARCHADHLADDRHCAAAD
ncbi:MAG: AAA family ATPase [Anaerolineae bacterium]|uniref:nSTAND1 domain-containing NTPase n=2 Tax=Candidatus Amarolinea dominans TaxID=3140696 RepID=UPI003135F234|nr:AAA family ATPase [Anaerolineae bacterium]